MRLNKFMLAFLFLGALVVVSCNKDDDNTEVVPPRDRGEQDVADQEALKKYLETHFYNYEEFENPSEDFDYNVRIDTLDGANADKTPLIESDQLIPKTFAYEGVDYKFYVLKVREGVKDQPKFTDSTFVSYRGELLNRTMFDNAVSPVWFDLTQTIPGFAQGIVEFKGASGFQVNSDNTIEWNNDFGVGAIFLPSGLAYFSNAQAAIPAYSPIVFNIHLYGVNEADHDRDGIPSWMEDLNKDNIIFNDDTDKDGRPNYLDTDDDGDKIPTREEIVIEEDGSLTFPDGDNDGTPNYLDPDYIEGQ